MLASPLWRRLILGTLSLLIALAVSFPVYIFTDASAPVCKGLFVLALVGMLWMTEAIPLTFAALLVPVLTILLGLSITKIPDPKHAGASLTVTSVEVAFKPFANYIIFVFLGGFGLAAALSKQRLDIWLAGAMLRLARGNLLWGSFGLLLATAMVSMWISNTATAAMMLPLALGLLGKVDAKKHPQAFVFLLLGIAWASNIGGIGTLVGTPPNGIVAAEMNWNFTDWLWIGFPAMCVLLPISFGVLWLTTRPTFPEVAGVVEAEPFVWRPHTVLTLAIFLLTAFLWVIGDPLGKWLGIPKEIDAGTAMFGLCLLGITGCVTWEDVSKTTNWGVLLLFGGGLGMSDMMNTSGASDWLGMHLKTILPADYPFLFLLLVALFVIFLSELVSNTACAALMVALLVPLGSKDGVSQEAIAAVVGLAATCSFMLPVGTPPNALVYGTGYIPQKQMIRAGFVMNLISAVLLALMFSFSA